MWKNQFFEDKFKLIEENKQYSMYEYDCNGEGKLISYNVFDGIDIIFMEFNTSDIFVPHPQNNEIIEISWCRKGRVECEFANNTISYLQEGDFGINESSHIPIYYQFPLKNYDAVSLIINLKECSLETMKILEYFHIDINSLFSKLDLKRNWYISREDTRLKQLFSEVYQQKKKESSKYFCIKSIELLHYISSLSSLSKFEGKKMTYYKKEQIKKVKEIRNYLINLLDKKISIEKYVIDSGMAVTTFRSIFFQIYGDTPSAYLTKYKMAMASKLLENKSKSIMSIALSLGYSNPSKFTSAFKKQYKMLPKDYRKLNEESGYFK